TILPKLEDEFSATINEDEYYKWNGVKYTESGDYEQTLTSQTGCDSVVTLHLTVSHPIDIPYPDNVENVACVVPPMPSNFEMKELYRCEGANDMTTPLVADLDGDGITEIIATSSSLPGAYTYTCDQLLIYSGQNGNLLRTMPVTTFSLSGQPIAIADVDKDSKCEIFVVGTDHVLYCYDYLGVQKWHSSNIMDNPFIPMLADVNNDNIPEVVCDKYIYNAISGNLLLEIDLLETGMGFGAPNGINESKHYYPYYLPALADIDGNGTLELCAGNAIYKINLISENISTNSWTLLRKASTISQYADYNYDGQTIVLDFDGDGDLDICVLGASHTTTDDSKPYFLDTYVWDGQTNQIISFSRDTSTKWYADTRSTASIPFAGDINNDGLAEIMYNIPGGVGMCAYAYDSTVINKMRRVHKHRPWAETSGFTVFDFNMDGNNEIVSRTQNTLYIADGITLNNLCSPISAISQTMTEYPIVADVNGDGVAEIVVACTNDYSNRNGWLSVYGAAQPGTWSSARPVWNQWAYNSVNINKDMTIPQYQYDVATLFPNGTRPFNSFLAQKPIIDQQGDIFVPAADVTVTSASYEIKDDSIEISLSYCNTGDANLLAPYEISVYLNEYRGTLIQVNTIKESLNIDDCKDVTIKVPTSVICRIAQDTTLVITTNDEGHGIAQQGNQQAECDITNNQALISLIGKIRRDTTYNYPIICDSELPYTHPTTSIVFPIGTSGIVDSCVTLLNQQGCDSIIHIKLTILPTFAVDTFATINQGESLIWYEHTCTTEDEYQHKFQSLLTGCDSVVTLHLTVLPPVITCVDT
ncbi:MAG: VCBS repeat-containing protein, partial [Prevotellaceae bacterium]|nr:VCBS repeat-containing protein [Candidatus Faecinaster equi]